MKHRYYKIIDIFGHNIDIICTSLLICISKLCVSTVKVNCNCDLYKKSHLNLKETSSSMLCNLQNILYMNQL